MTEILTIEGGQKDDLLRRANVKKKGRTELIQFSLTRQSWATLHLFRQVQSRLNKLPNNSSSMMEEFN